MIAARDRSKDVNGNGSIEPMDPLLVINRLAKHESVGGEREAAISGAWIPAVDLLFSDTDDEDSYFDDWLLGLFSAR